MVMPKAPQTTLTFIGKGQYSRTTFESLSPSGAGFSATRSSSSSSIDAEWPLRSMHSNSCLYASTIRELGDWSRTISPARNSALSAAGIQSCPDFCMAGRSRYLLSFASISSTCSSNSASRSRSSPSCSSAVLRKTSEWRRDNVSSRFSPSSLWASNWRSYS